MPPISDYTLRHSPPHYDRCQKIKLFPLLKIMPKERGMLPWGRGGSFEWKGEALLDPRRTSISRLHGGFRDSRRKVIVMFLKIKPSSCYRPSTPSHTVIPRCACRPVFSKHLPDFKSSRLCLSKGFYLSTGLFLDYLVVWATDQTLRDGLGIEIMLLAHVCHVVAEVSWDPGVHKMRHRTTPYAKRNDSPSVFLPVMVKLHQEVFYASCQTRPCRAPNSVLIIKVERVGRVGNSAIS